MNARIAAPIILAALSVVPFSASAEATLFDLDTAAGAFSVWRVTDLTARSVSFVATFAAVRKDAKWAPHYGVQLKDAADNKINFTGSYTRGDVPSVKATLSMAGKDSELAPESNLVLTVGKPSRVKLEWADGSIKLTVDGMSQEYKVNFAPSAIEISASTGELEVKELSFEK